jgi:hypothetical protein
MPQTFVVSDYREEARVYAQAVQAVAETALRVGTAAMEKHSTLDERL